MGVDMDILGLLAHLMPNDLSTGRLLESAIMLTIIWRKLKPHLKTLEDRLAGLENAVQTGFNSGELRFQKIEERITALEKTP